MPEDEEFNYNVAPELDFNQLFVYVDFIKPGKQQYFVNYYNEFSEPVPELPPKTQEELQKEQNPWYTTTNESVSEEEDYSRSKDKKPKKITQEDIDNFEPIISPVSMTSYH